MGFGKIGMVVSARVNQVMVAGSEIADDVARSASAAKTKVKVPVDAAKGTGQVERAVTQLKFGIRNTFTGVGFAVTGDAARASEHLAKAGRQGEDAISRLGDAIEAASQASKAAS